MTGFAIKYKVGDVIRWTDSNHPVPTVGRITKIYLPSMASYVIYTIKIIKHANNYFHNKEITRTSEECESRTCLYKPIDYTKYWAQLNA